MQRIARDLKRRGRIGFVPTFVVDITTGWDAKRRAILAHQSQVARPTGRSRPTPLNEPDFIERIEARARHFGAQIGTRYGEPFHSSEPIGFRALDALFRTAHPKPGSFTG